MAASEDALGTLHDKVANTLSRLLDGTQMPDYTDPETEEVIQGERLEPSAAILTASIQFLKNNNITCAPSEDNALGKLKQKMEERQARRKERATRTDLNHASDDMGWLGNQIGGHA